MRIDRRGRPLVWTLTGGQRHEQTQLPTLLETGAIKRRGPGRPRLRPACLAGDKGYSSRTVRRYLRRRGIRAVIPTHKNERRHPRFDRAAYRERALVERWINRLKPFRAIATRYDKLQASFHALITVVVIRLLL